jgi:signal transduction histidine kinase
MVREEVGVAELVVAMGGAVEVTSTRGSGTVFRVTLRAID